MGVATVLALPIPALDEYLYLGASPAEKKIDIDRSGARVGSWGRHLRKSLR